jgi:hypothetical protein
VSFVFVRRGQRGSGHKTSNRCVPHGVVDSWVVCVTDRPSVLHLKSYHQPWHACCEKPSAVPQPPLTDFGNGLSEKDREKQGAVGYGRLLWPWKKCALTSDQADSRSAPPDQPNKTHPLLL